MSGRTRTPLPLVAAVAAVLLAAAAAAAYAVTRQAPSAHSAAPVAAAPSAVKDAAVTAVARAKVTLTPAKPVASKPTVLATAPVATAPAPPRPRSRTQPHAFDSARAMAHVRKLASDIGLRVGGSGGEWRAIVYARDYLTALGYDVTVTAVRLDNGKTTHNVIARHADAAGPIVVLGGHIDSKYPSPGADDNATGVGTVLELARDFAQSRPKADVRFVAFGCEELIGDGNGDHHHYGSRAYARSLTDAERARFAAMISIDMIGYGSDFRVRSMGLGPRLLCDQLLVTAKTTGAPLAYLKDTGASGWSDHEAFEKAGFPSAWLEWRDDPKAHTAGDTVSRLDARKVDVTGRLVHVWLRQLDAAKLDALVAQ